MIYTTYFAKLRSLPKDIIPIAICAKSPAGYTGLEYQAIAPRYELLIQWKNTKDNAYYIKCFNEQVLSTLNPTKVVADLYHKAERAYCDGDIALVCYEKPTDFCHRHLVATWLRNNGFPCEEYKYN